MSFSISIGECRQSIEDGYTFWLAPSYCNDPENYQYYRTAEGTIGVTSCNWLTLNNNGTMRLMELLGLFSWRGFYENGESMFVDINPRFIALLQMKIQDYRVNYDIHPLVYGNPIERHDFGLLVWMEKWCRWALRHCVHPVVIFN